MDIIGKLTILSDTTKYDVACISSGTDRAGEAGSIGNAIKGGIWERRKLQKEIAEQEKKRSDFYKETAEKYGTKPQL